MKKKKSFFRAAVRLWAEWGIPRCNYVEMSGVKKIAWSFVPLRTESRHTGVATRQRGGVQFHFPSRTFYFRSNYPDVAKKCICMQKNPTIHHVSFLCRIIKISSAFFTEENKFPISPRNPLLSRIFVGEKNYSVRVINFNEEATRGKFRSRNFARSFRYLPDHLFSGSGKISSKTGAL